MDFYNVGKKQSRKSKMDLAEQNYKKALELDSANSLAYSGLGILKMNSKDVNELNLAREYFYKSILFDSSNAEVWNFVGYTYLQELKLTETIKI